MDLRAVRIALVVTLVAAGGHTFAQSAAASTPSPESPTVAPVPKLKATPRATATPAPTPAPMGRTKAVPPALEEALGDRLGRLEMAVAALTKRVAALDSDKATLSATVANDEKAIAALRVQFEHHKHCLPGQIQKIMAGIGHNEDPLHSVSSQVPLSQTCSR